MTGGLDTKCVEISETGVRHEGVWWLWLKVKWASRWHMAGGFTHRTMIFIHVYRGGVILVTSRTGSHQIGSHEDKRQIDSMFVCIVLCPCVSRAPAPARVDVTHPKFTVGREGTVVEAYPRAVRSAVGSLGGIVNPHGIVERIATDSYSFLPARWLDPHLAGGFRHKVD